MNATDRWKIIQNITAQVGVDGDIINELAKVESTINAIDQGKMIPPPIPPEITEPTESPIESPLESPEQTNTSPI